MDFPEKVYTEEEHKKAKKLVDAGYKHELTVSGDAGFRGESQQGLGTRKDCGMLRFLENLPYDR